MKTDKQITDGAQAKQAAAGMSDDALRHQIDCFERHNDCAGADFDAYIAEYKKRGLSDEDWRDAGEIAAGA